MRQIMLSAILWIGFIICFWPYILGFLFIAFIIMVLFPDKDSRASKKAMKNFESIKQKELNEIDKDIDSIKWFSKENKAIVNNQDTERKMLELENLQKQYKVAVLIKAQNGINLYNAKKAVKNSIEKKAELFSCKVSEAELNKSVWEDERVVKARAIYDKAEKEVETIKETFYKTKAELLIIWAELQKQAVKNKKGE